MTKNDLLRHIAQTGYNVGYGAKKHFATYDIASKAPGTIGFCTFTVGVVFLLLDFAAKKYFSAACIILGALGMRITMWDHKRDMYDEVGRKLTGVFNEVKALYYNVKASESVDLAPFEAQLAKLQEGYSEMGLSNQMLFSDWYAHYKFFWQQQIDWMDEQIKFRFFRDKLPLSFMVAVGVLVVIAISLVAFTLYR